MTIIYCLISFILGYIFYWFTHRPTGLQNLNSGGGCIILDERLKEILEGCPEL